MAGSSTGGIIGAFKSFGLVLMFFILLTGSFFIGRFIFPKGKDVIVERTVEKRDTVWLRDTIKTEIPKPEIVYLTRVDTVSLREAADTIFVRVEVPIERKVFTTEDYKATIDGFRVNLVEMDIYRKTQIITEYQTVTQKIPNRWGIGVHAGYSYIPTQNKFAPTISLGVQYNLLTW